MPKRKKVKHARKSGGRGRRMGGASADLQPVLVGLGAAVIAQFASKQMPSKYAKYIPAATAAAGILAIMMGKGPLLKAAGFGLSIAGGLQLAANNIPGLSGARKRMGAGYSMPNTIGNGSYQAPGMMGAYKSPSALGQLGRIQYGAMTGKQ